MARKMLLLVLGAALAAVAGLPAGAAEGGFKRLGSDAELDAAPSFDLTSLDVRRAGKDLEIRIGISGMTPPWGSAIPYLPGVQWTFDVKKKTYIAEAYTDPTSDPGFLLFEKRADAFVQITDLEGTYDWQDGFVSMRVPLKKIGARKGTLISGTGKKGTNDVDFHIHLGATTEYLDYLATTKNFRVP